jgi:hypothetical protein
VSLNFDYLRYPLQAFSLVKDNNLLDLLDKTIQNTTNFEHELCCAIEVALLCVELIPENHPSMSHVLAMLQGAMNLHKREEIMIPMEIEMGATNTTITSESTRYKTASDSTRYNSLLYVPF